MKLPIGTLVVGTTFKKGLIGRVVEHGKSAAGHIVEWDGDGRMLVSIKEIRRATKTESTKYGYYGNKQLQADLKKKSRLAKLKRSITTKLVGTKLHIYFDKVLVKSVQIKGKE